MEFMWEKFCTVCICVPCGLGPRCSLAFISSLSLLIALTWIGLGAWLAVVVIINGNLPYEEQIFFEKLRVIDATHENYFDNESSLVFTPLDNLKFYFLAMSVISVVGGIGRAIASLSLMHYVYKTTLTAVMSWAWVILSMLSVVSLGIMTVDTLYTLSRDEVTPPHNRDFYFKNDNFGFYAFCHTFKWLILTDFVTSLYFQWVVRWGYRKAPFASQSTS